MSGTERRTVHGYVEFPVGEAPDRPVTVRIRVEDISRADAPATVVAAAVRSAVTPTAGRRVPFAIDVPPDAGAPGRRCVLRVHVDVDGTGEVTVGDLVSTVSSPLPPDAGAVTVPVRRVGA